MAKAEIFVIDDDPQIRYMLEAQLGARGYKVSSFASGIDGLDAITQCKPHLIILDIMMPGMDGLDVCRLLRRWSEVPVILLTCSDAPRTKIAALDMGADDYLTKPFHMGELVARVGAVLRRARNDDAVEQPIIETADLTIDLRAREVRRAGEPVQLTKTEFELLRELVVNPGRALTYQYLYSAVWGHEQTDTHLVQVHMANLRRKIDTSPLVSRAIRAIPGVGYRLDSP